MQAWVGAGEAGYMAMVPLLLPVVEQRGGEEVNCTDRLGQRNKNRSRLQFSLKAGPKRPLFVY